QRLPVRGEQVVGDRPRGAEIHRGVGRVVDDRPDRVGRRVRHASQLQRLRAQPVGTSPHDAISSSLRPSSPSRNPRISRPRNPSSGSGWGSVPSGPGRTVTVYGRPMVRHSISTRSRNTTQAGTAIPLTTIPSRTALTTPSSPRATEPGWPAAPWVTGTGP